MSYTTSQVVGLRVLVVGSNEDSLFLVAAALEVLQVNVLAVKSAREALRALRHFQPELLISELCLPEEDGYSLMRKVKAYLDCQKRQIPAIALTTQVSPEAQAQAYSVGFCRHLAKPYDLQALVEMIVQLAGAKPLLLGSCQCCI